MPVMVAPEVPPGRALVPGEENSRPAPEFGPSKIYAKLGRAAEQEDPDGPSKIYAKLGRAAEQEDPDVIAILWNPRSYLEEHQSLSCYGSA
jgi:hypothetical protein